jgi:hypothetical protein
MSLVREALEKAEREAAARAAREKGLGPQLAATTQPYRAPRRRPRAMVAGALVAVAIGGVALAIYLRQPRDAAPPAATERSADAVLEPIAEPAAPVAAAAATAGVEPPAPALEEPVVAAAAAPPAEPVATPPATRPATPPSPVAIGEAREYVREAVLDGGAARLELGGIAWSEAAPLAYLNGKLRGVGEVVAGLRIERIDRDRVTLAAGERRIVLRLR